MAKVYKSRYRAAQREPSAWDWVDNVTRGLDYLGNITRTAEMAAINPSMARLRNVLDAIKIEHYTSPTEVKDAITEKLFGKKLRAGVDDGKFQLGDVFDFAADFGIDLVSDPLVIMSGGVSKAIQGVAKTTRAARLGAKASRLNRALKVLGTPFAAVRPVVGAATGAAAVPDDAPLAAKILGAGAGLATLGMAPRHLGKFLQKYDIGTKYMAAQAVKNMGGFPDKIQKTWDAKGAEILKKAASDWKYITGVSKYALGGMYGYSMSNPDSHIANKVMNGLLGAVGVWGAGKIFPTLRKVLSTGSNRVVDAYHEVARGFKEGKVPGHLGMLEKDIRNMAEVKVNKVLKKKFPKPKTLTPAERTKYEATKKALYNAEAEKLKQPVAVSESFVGARDAGEKLRTTVKIIQSEEAAALGSKLSPAEFVAAVSMERRLKAAMLKERARLIKERLGIDVAKTKSVPYEKAKELDEITKEANAWSRENIEQILGKDIDKDVFTRFDKHRAFMHRIKEKYNLETESNLVGLEFYVPEIHAKQDVRTMNEYLNAITRDKAQIHFATGTLYDEAGNLANPRMVPLRYAISDPVATAKIGKLDKWAKEQTTSINQAIDFLKGRKPGKNMNKAARKAFKERLDTDIAYLKANIDDINASADIEARSILDGIKVTEDGIMREHAEYYRRMAYNFLDKKERQMLQIAGAVKNMRPKDKYLAGFEDFLKGYDKIHHFIKTLMLGGNISWLRTNYWSNLGRAYIENDIPTTIRTAAFGYNKKLWKDILDITKNKTGIFRHKDSADILKYGVLENPMYSMIGDPHADIVRLYRGRSNIADEFTKDPKKFADKVKKFFDKAATPFRAQMDFLQKGRIPFTKKEMWMIAPFQLGTMMESTARSTTFLNQVDFLKKNGFEDFLMDTIYKGQKKGPKLSAILDDHTKRVAADITKKTFFDYQKVQELERTLAKRLIPFWTFYTRNIPYWFNGLLDLQKVGKIAVMDKIRRNIGTAPTAEQREGMPEWLAGLTPRYISDTAGGRRYATFPYSDLYEAIRSTDPSRVGRILTEKMSPLVKTPYEFATGQELFTDSPLLPSKSRKGQKYAFSRGWKWKFVQDWLNKLGLDGKPLGVDLDVNGNPIFTKDTVKAIDKLFETFYPLGIVDKAAGTVGKYLNDKENPFITAVQTVTPVQLPEQSDNSARYYRKRFKIQERLKKKIKRQYGGNQ